MHIDANNKFDFYCFKNFTIPFCETFWILIGSVARWGLGPRNDVLTTCKAVTFRGGQRIIKVVFIVVLEAKSGKLDGLSLSRSENKGLGEVLSLVGP